MKVLVCGGRDYRDRERLFATLDGLPDVSVIISGMAKGADSLAAAWAKERGKPLMAFPADWRAHGRRAGPIRNVRMLMDGKPDLVVAFPGGKGTADMVKRSRASGVKVIEVSNHGWTKEEISRNVRERLERSGVSPEMAQRAADEVIAFTPPPEDGNRL